MTDKLTGPRGGTGHCYVMTQFIHSPQCFAVDSAETLTWNVAFLSSSDCIYMSVK